MAGAAVRLTDVLISRQHVRLNVEAKRITLEDLGSANGTYVNAQRIADDAPVTLHDGDTIAIGDTVLVLQATSSMPAPQPRPAPVTPSVELPTQIATAPPKSMAEQLVADQSARLAPTGGLRRTAVPVTPVQPQYTKPAAALPISIVKPTLITAGCFGLILALAVIPLRAAGDLPDSLVWLGLAIVLQWLTIDLAWRQLGVKTTRGRLLGVMACWAIAGAAGLGAAYALVGTISNISGADEIIAILLIATTFAAICGSLGGLLTSRVLGPVIPQLQTKATTLGWLLAWVIGIDVATLMLNQSQGANLEPALAICGALIGAIGGGTMFWQIAQTDQPARLAVVRQPIGSSRPAADVSTARRAIASICGGWVAIGLLAVLLAQSAQSAADTATYLCLGYGLGCGALGYVLPRVVPSLRRAAWQLAGGWALVLIGAIQLGVIVQLESNWLSMAGVGLCGVIAAWVVCADVPGVPRWHYAVIGVIWLLAYVIGSGYAWHMVTYKAATHGWSLAATLDAMGSSVFALVLGAVLSAAIGGVALYRVLLRARA